MSFLAQLFRLCWIACCALALVAQTRLLLGIPLTFSWLDGFIFGGTVFGYHFAHPVIPYRYLAWGLGIAGGICLWMAGPSDWGARLVLLAPVLCWLAYYGVLGLGAKGLRRHIFAKPLTIALSWAWVTVLLPAPVPFWPKLALLFLGRASFIFALAVAYDLVDLERDQARGFSTLAGRLGFRRAFAVMYWSLGLSALCVGMNGALGVYSPPHATGLFISLAISAWWLQYLLPKKAGGYWQKPLIDGLMVLQFGLAALIGAAVAG